MPFSGSGGAVAASSIAGFEIGYDQVTANVTVSSATEATGTTVISCAAHTFDGTAAIATFFCPIATPANADAIVVCLFEGATEIGKICQANGSNTTTTASFPLTGMLRFTPTAASHTYTVTAFRVTVNGTLNCGAGGTGAFVPMFIRFTKA